MSKIINILVIILLLGSLGYLSYEFYKNIPQGTKSFFIIPKEDKLLANTSKDLTMFMSNMRFATNDISYAFIDCNTEKQKQMTDAFQIITSQTQKINFHATQLSPMITVYCSQQKGEERNNSFVAGEGGPNKILALDLYPLIIDGKIYIYDSNTKEQCSYPVIELHELLHVFGFDHVSNKSTVLYPYLECDQRITKEMVDKLTELYSIEPKADLTIKNLSASTSGRYLSFEIVINNRGLTKAQNIGLNIYDAKGEVGNSTLTDMDPGISQTLTISNMELPLRPITDLTFKITTNTPEYFYDNNNVTASVKQ